MTYDVIKFACDAETHFQLQQLVQRQGITMQITLQNHSLSNEVHVCLGISQVPSSIEATIHEHQIPWFCLASSLCLEPLSCSRCLPPAAWQSYHEDREFFRQSWTDHIITDTVYKYWLVLRATLHNWRALFFCWLRLTVNICFVISRNKRNKFVSSSMTQQHRIHIDLPNTAVRPKIDTNAWCHVVYTIFPRNMTMHWPNRATLFIFAHHVTRIGPLTIA